jgi:hypothetical protein
VRRIFIQVSPELLSILTFGRGVPLGLVLLLVYGAVLGLLGAGFRLLPERIRRPVGVGLAATLTFALLQRIFPPLLFELGLDTRWLYSPVLLGLTIPGALVVFAVSAGLTALWSARGPVVRERVDQLPPSRRKLLNGTRPAAAGRRPGRAAPAHRLDPVPGAGHGGHLPADGAGPEHRGRLRGPARPRATWPSSPPAPT